MYYLRVLIVILFYGISHIYGFFHLRHEHLLFDQNVSVYNSILPSPQPFWVEQPVDHFNKSDQRTWKMKYYKIMDYWKQGGAIVMYFRGEAPLSLHGLAMTYGNSQRLINRIAKETEAALFFLEHRYYGDSQPFDELTTENMTFLTSKQALADAAYLLQTIKNSPEFKDSKVIVIGASYAGNLAAWMKLLYPSLVDAVLSSSAPVLAKKDFKEYLEGVTETYRTYGSQECVNNITDKFNTIHVLLQSAEGIKKLKEEQSICEEVDMTVPDNQQLFFSVEIDSYAEYAQYSTPKDIVKVCQLHNLNKLEHVLPVVWNNEFNCYDYDYNNWINNTSRTARSWWYQTCTEFGYFQSTSSSKQMFGDYLPVDFFYKTCTLLFGEEFNEERVDQGVMKTNEMYGGLSPNVEHVVFSNGDMDPWHRLGILHALSDDAPAIYIKGSSHGYDLSKPSPDDNVIIQEARLFIKYKLKQWIGVV